MTDPLAALGLRAGEPVRFQRVPGGRWHQGTVAGVEKDGSIAVRDSRGAARSLPLDRLHVRAAGPRGAATWEPAACRTGRPEQLSFL